MFAYIVRRLLLIIPTLLAIITVNFFIIQAAPGGPVDQMIAKMQGIDSNMGMDRIAGKGQEEVRSGESKKGDAVSRGSRGLDPEVIAEIEKQYGFDKPLGERYFNMLLSYLRFDFGESLFKGRTVLELIKERMPVSISLGVWSTLIIYLVSIPLGIRKAVKHGSKFDMWTSFLIILGNSIPSFLFGILLIILFAGGSFLSIFPLRGLVSTDFEQLSWFGKIMDYIWHMILPVFTIVIGGFTSLTLLTKNSFLDEINKQYVLTARAKGLTEKRVLFGHVFRNGMLLIIAGFPAAFISMFFTGSLLIEVIFSLDGLGLLGYEAIMQRDYPVVFSTLYIFSLLGLVLGIISDIVYTVVDPRIDFEKR